MLIPSKESKILISCVTIDSIVIGKALFKDEQDV